LQAADSTIYRNNVTYAPGKTIQAVQGTATVTNCLEDNTDPDWTMENSGDFSLEATSPCLDAGDTASLCRRDIRRALRNVDNPDQGAFERGASAPSATTVAWVMTDAARSKLVDGTFDLDSNTFKCALFLPSSNIGTGSTTYASLTNEHGNANGYTTGGVAVALTLAGTTTVTADASADPSWTASGGNIVARFAVIYEVGGDVLCYCRLGNAQEDFTCKDGNRVVVGTPIGIFTLA
jgi:hypothetical protein